MTFRNSKQKIVICITRLKNAILQVRARCVSRGATSAQRGTILIVKY
jgi:hypothetical protein